MPYFAVDDGAPMNRKFLRLGAHRLAAGGLWTFTGAWASKEVTGGWVGESALMLIGGADWELLRNELVRVGLWHFADGEGNLTDAAGQPVECDCVVEVEPFGEPGIQFHEYAERNGSREQRLSDRAAAAERKRRSRARQAAAAGGDEQRDGANVTRDVTPHVTASVTRDRGVTSRAREPRPRPSNTTR